MTVQTPLLQLTFWPPEQFVPDSVSSFVPESESMLSTDWNIISVGISGLGILGFDISGLGTLGFDMSGLDKLGFVSTTLSTGSLPSSALSRSSSSVWQ